MRIPDALAAARYIQPVQRRKWCTRGCSACVASRWLVCLLPNSARRDRDVVLHHPPSVMPRGVTLHNACIQARAGVMRHGHACLAAQGSQRIRLVRGAKKLPGTSGHAPARPPTSIAAACSSVVTADCVCVADRLAPRAATAGPRPRARLGASTSLHKCPAAFVVAGNRVSVGGRSPSTWLHKKFWLKFWSVTNARKNGNNREAAGRVLTCRLWKSR